MRWVRVWLLALVFGAAGHTDTYRVRNRLDTGAGSLRWAIQQANTHIGRDKIIFAPSMSGKVIRPNSALPEITDHRTIINGDINDDGKPDVAINGKNAGLVRGIVLRGARFCTLRGLAVCGFASTGIEIRESNYTSVKSCHVGVNLPGTKAVNNTGSNIHVVLSDHCSIGGTTPAERNIIAGSVGAYRAGICVVDGSYVTITGNYIGLTRDGQAVLGTGGIGIMTDTVKFPSEETTIGGTASGTRNVFGGLDVGLLMQHASNHAIIGNYFGLLADGDALAGISTHCIEMRLDSHDNLIGGTAAGTGNVFAGGADAAIRIEHDWSQDNKIRGNYFGLNAAGTKQRRLRMGIELESDAGAQIIGGGTAQAGNYFTPGGGTGGGVGIYFKHGGGAGSLVRRNRFGVRPSGQNAVGLSTALEAEATVVSILDNVFARCSNYGVFADNAGANPKVFRNTFRGCERGVSINDDARCRLGNLGNTSTADDGGNIFSDTNTYHIYNNTANRISAQGNDFGTTSRAAINAKILDIRDNPTRGRVVYSPLIGGILPTEAALHLTAATALPTARGAEISFTFSAPANVSIAVLNIAGRPISTVVRDAPTDPGTQRIVWSGRTDGGLAVPAGVYLVRIAGRGSDGRQAQALCALQLRR